MRELLLASRTKSLGFNRSSRMFHSNGRETSLIFRFFLEVSRSDGSVSVQFDRSVDSHFLALLEFLSYLFCRSGDAALGSILHARRMKPLFKGLENAVLRREPRSTIAGLSMTTGRKRADPRSRML